MCESGDVRDWHHKQEMQAFVRKKYYLNYFVYRHEILLSWRYKCDISFYLARRSRRDFSFSHIFFLIYFHLKFRIVSTLMQRCLFSSFILHVI